MPTITRRKSARKVNRLPEGKFIDLDDDNVLVPFASSHNIPWVNAATEPQKLEAEAIKFARMWVDAESPQFETFMHKTYPDVFAKTSYARLTQQIQLIFKHCVTPPHVDIRFLTAPVSVSPRHVYQAAETSNARIHAKTESKLPEAATKEPSAEQLLSRLRTSQSLASRLDAAIWSEVVEFNGPSSADLVSLLHRFVMELRENNEHTVKVAVGAAIRKMILSTDDCTFPLLLDLLTPPKNGPLHLDHELEITKSLCRRLVASPLINRERGEELRVLLSSIVNLYCDVRLLGRPLYGTVALNAVLSLLLIGGDDAPEVAAKVREAGAPWFSELVERRSLSVITELQEEHGKEAGSELANGLIKLCEQGLRA